MSYLETIYKNALNECENIYRESQYNKDVDLYRSYDIMNSVNETQLKSKQWLVDTLVPFLTDEQFEYNPLRDIVILGGWYGMNGMLLRQKIDNDINIWSVDTDPLCLQYSYALQAGNDDYKNNYAITDDALDYFFTRADAYQLIINTSCEHMEPDDIRLMLGAKTREAMICFQSNNYHSIQSHINTHNSLDEFVESLDLAGVLWKGEKKVNEECDRYMVIGV